jgi:hypothetical protein
VGTQAVKKRPAPALGGPTPEELAALNEGFDSSGPTAEELAALNASPEEGEAGAAGAASARAAVPSALRPPAAAPTDSEATAAGQGAATAGAKGAPEPPGFFGRIGASLRGSGRDLAAEPTRAAADPRGAGRAARVGANDAIFLGLAEPTAKLEDYRGLRARTQDGQQFKDDADREAWFQLARLGKVDDPNAHEQDLLADIDAAQKHPGARLGMSIATPGPATVAGGLAGKAAQGLAPAIKLIKPAVSGLVTGAVSSGAPSALRGDSLGDVLSNTAEGAGAGLAVGTASHAAPVAARAVRKGLGVILPNVGRFAQAREAGLIPHAEELPEGRVGVQAAGEEAVDAIRARQEARQADIGGRHAAAVEKYGPELADLTPMAEQLNTMRAQNRMKPQGGRPGTLFKGREALDKAARDTQNAVYEERNRTNSDLIEQRRSAREAGAPGKPFPTAKQKAYRKIGKALGSTLPAELEEADTAYARNERGTENENRTVFGKPKPRTVNEAPGSPATLDPYERTTGGERLSRINDETEPAKRLQTRIEKLAERDPVYRRAIDAIVAKKALEETRFGRPGTGEQNTLPDVTGVNALLKLGKKQAGAVARRVDDRLLRPAAKANLAPFLGGYGRRNRQDEDQP